MPIRATWPSRSARRSAPLKPRASSLKPIRRGLTLVELLVVIVLLLIVTAVAIPVLAPNSEQRRIREGARLVSTFLSGARNRAIELGRPVGVQFERLASNPNASMVLSYAEVPPMYAGETLGSACSIYRTTGGQWQAYMEGGGASSFNNTLIRRGDLLKVNFQGYLYEIIGPDTDGNATTTTLDAGTDTLDIKPIAAAINRWPIADPADETAKQALPDFPYQIIRQPIKSGDAPLQMPEGAVVDLLISGEGYNGALSSASGAAPLVLFSPNGAATQVYHFDPSGGPTYRAPNGPIHLLIGRSDGVGANDASFTDPKVPWNLRDMNNLWVSVVVQTGLVSTAENARVSAAAGTILSAPDPTFSTALGQARGIAQSFQSMGGR